MLPEAKQETRTKGLHIKTIITAAFAALALVAGGGIQPAQAQTVTYDFTFNGGGTSANGQLEITDDTATGGYLDITSGTGIGDYNLYTWIGEGSVGSSVRVNGGTDLIVDNDVNVNLSPPVDSAGLAFISSSLDGGGDPIEGINLSANGDTVNVAGFGTDGYGAPNANGVLAFTECASVPEPSSTALLSAGGAFAGIVLYRRKSRAAAQG